MSDLESVEEDGQMMLHKKRPLWLAQPELQLLHCWMSLGTSKKGSPSPRHAGSVKNSSDTELEEVVDEGDLGEWYMCLYWYAGSFRAIAASYDEQPR